MTFDKGEELSDTCKKLGRAIRTAETQAVSVVQKDYANLLKEALQKISAHDFNSSGGTVLRVQQAQFQADGLLN